MPALEMETVEVVQNSCSEKPGISRCHMCVHVCVCWLCMYKGKNFPISSEPWGTDSITSGTLCNPFICLKSVCDVDGPIFPQFTQPEQLSPRGSYKNAYACHFADDCMQPCSQFSPSGAGDLDEHWDGGFH